MTEKMGSAISPHDAQVDVNKSRLTGPIITPPAQLSIDLSTASEAEVQAHLDQIFLYRQLGGRPAIQVYSPAAGSQVVLYCDGVGGSHEVKPA